MYRKRLLALLLFFSSCSFAQEYEYNYSFFSNSQMPGDYFFSQTDNSGSFIYNRNFRLLVNERIFHTPGNSLELGYINAKKGFWKATIFKQQQRGMDHFKKTAFLSFWVFNTSTDSMAANLPVIQLMNRDSSLTEKLFMPITATNEWQQVLIPTSGIKNFDAGNSLNYIAIVFSQQTDTVSGKKQTMYLDDIEFLPAANVTNSNVKPQITHATGYAAHVDITWNEIADKSIRVVKVYRSTDGKAFKAVGIQQPYINRYADFTGEAEKEYFYKISFLNDKYKESEQSPAVSASTRKMTDPELMTMVQEASFRYYWDGAEPSSGLAKENIAGRQNMIATGASGFGILALIAGTERKFISRNESVDRFLKIVHFLEKAETFHGVFPHFLDGPTGKVEPFFGNRDNGADLVETSFLMQGLLTARQYFSGNNSKEKEIRDKITIIWERAEWDWFKQYPDSKFLYWHWSPDQGWVINHKLIGWNETMITYLLAIASPTHGVPASMYYSGFANQDSTGQQYRTAWSGTNEGSMYTNGNSYYGIKLDVGVSDGGPLFFTHYSYMGYDPRALTDNYTNYFRNNQKIALINLRYCMENPNHHKDFSDSCWGLTASDGPYRYSADEPVISRDPGKIAPTGAIASMPYTHEESMKALKNYYFNYGSFLWGEYGFRDAFDLEANWCSGIYMGLNQAPITVMIENYRTGLLWKLLMSDKDIKTGNEKLQQETQVMKNNRR